MDPRIILVIELVGALLAVYAAEFLIMGIIFLRDKRKDREAFQKHMEQSYSEVKETYSTESDASCDTCLYKSFVVNRCITKKLSEEEDANAKK